MGQVSSLPMPVHMLRPPPAPLPVEPPVPPALVAPPAVDAPPVVTAPPAPTAAEVAAPPAPTAAASAPPAPTAAAVAPPAPTAAAVAPPAPTAVAPPVPLAVVPVEPVCPSAGSLLHACEVKRTQSAPIEKDATVAMRLFRFIFKLPGSLTTKSSQRAQTHFEQKLELHQCRIESWLRGGSKADRETPEIRQRFGFGLGT
jgi:hypothetical protein